jgi:flagellar export protein FliJ
MPPVFSLENVLNIRHDKVEVLEVELSKMMKLLIEAETILETLKKSQSDLLEKLTEAQSGELDLFEISLLRSNILTIDGQIAVVKQELVRLESLVNQKRSELIQAKQEEETLQILKRKRIETYNAEQAHLEAKIQDDIYIAQAFRQRRQET